MDPSGEKHGVWGDANSVPTGDATRPQGFGDQGWPEPVDQTTSASKPSDSQNSRPRVRYWNLFTSNWLYVVTYCAAFGSFGVCVGFLGPTVFDLGCQTNSDLKMMNWVFFTQLLMTLVGSITSGCMADRINNHLLLLAGAGGAALFMVAIPACSSLGGLLVVLMLMGWCMGCIDCIANLRMLAMYGRNVAPFLQAMHCFYGFGAFVSPMIASAFLLNKDCSSLVDGYTTTQSLRQGENVTVEVPPQPRLVFRYRNMSHLPTAFYILGTMQFLVAILLTFVIVRERLYGMKPPADAHEGSQALHHTGAAKDVSLLGVLGWLKERCFACGPRDVFIVTILTASAIFCFDGLQSTYANYIYTYALESDVPGLKQYEGATLDACFWGLFASGRLIAIPLAIKFTPAFMLLINILGSVLALLINLIFRTHAAIYVATCMVGAFVSSMSPSLLAMAEQYVDVNSSITTVLVVSAALGEALCPIIVGNLVISMGPTSFLAFCFTLAICSLLLYWAIFGAGREMPKFLGSGRRSFIWNRGSTPVHEGENSAINAASVKYYSRMSESDSNLEMGAVTSPPPQQNGGGMERP